MAGKEIDFKIDPEELPFICERYALVEYGETFTVSGRSYKEVADLLHKEAETSKGGSCFMDKHGCPIVFLNKRVPLFDSFDAKHDFRHWNWFYFVADFKTLEPISLVTYFGTEKAGDWDWYIYEDIRNHDGSKLAGPSCLGGVFFGGVTSRLGGC